MKIKTLILENFRCFKDRILVDFDDIITFVGKNDSGKSTILEALDIFLNDKDARIKIDSQDSNIYNEKEDILIGVIFDEFPDEVVIDTTSPTSLKEEYLLNKDGLFEVHKIYKNGKNTNINIFANYPKNEKLLDLLSLKIEDLKKRAEDIDATVEDNRKSADFRKGIRKKIEEDEDVRLEEIELSIELEGTKMIWKKMSEEFMPLFFLFQSDRENKDKDSEVQDPIQISVLQALKQEEVIKLLEKVREKVEELSRDVADRTIANVREMNPALAETLEVNLPKERDLKWNTVFKNLGILSDNIPLNKRGSGVRRLILLNFLKAEAEKRKESRDMSSIIFAIEEPETSQHPNYQKILISSLINLSQAKNTQIILTTHSPNLAQLLPVESLRFVDNQESFITDIAEDKNKIKKVVDTLGLMPEYKKLLLCVEGERDKRFLMTINKNCPSLKEIINLEEDLDIFSLGGSQLQKWIKENYLDDSNIVEFCIFDKDKDEKYLPYIQKIKDRKNLSSGCLTNRKELENYIPLCLIEKEFEIDCSSIKGEHDTIDIPEFIYKNCNKEFNEDKTVSIEIIKDVLNFSLSKKINENMLLEMGVFEEIKGWMKELKNIIIKLF